MGTDTLLCHGHAFCGAQHGVHADVQGAGRERYADRFLDIAYHAALDFEASVESFPGTVQDQEVLCCAHPNAQRRAVCPCWPCPAPAAVLCHHHRHAGSDCPQWCHARHCRRRNLHERTVQRGAGTMDRLAGSILQYCQNRGDGRIGLSGRHVHRPVRRDPSMDGRHAHHSRHHVRHRHLPLLCASLQGRADREDPAAGRQPSGAMGCVP